MTEVRVEVHAVLPTGEQVPWVRGCFRGIRGGEQGAERYEQGVRAFFTCPAVLSRGAQLWGLEVGVQERRNAGEGK